MPDTLEPPSATPTPAPTSTAPTASSGDEPAVAVAANKSVVAQLVAMRATGAQFIKKFGTSNDINALVRESGTGGIIIPDNSASLMLVGEGGPRFSATGDIIDAEVVLASGQRAIVSRFGGDIMVVPPRMTSVRNKLIDRYVRKYPGDLVRWQEEARELERRGQPLPPLLSYLRDSGRFTTPTHGPSGSHEGQSHSAGVAVTHKAGESLRTGSSSASVVSGSSAAVSGGGAAIATAATAVGAASSVTEIEASLTQARVQLQSAQAQLSAYGRPKEMTRTGEDGHYESTDPEYNKLSQQVELSAGNVRSLFALRNSAMGAGASAAVVSATGMAAGENTLTGSMAAPFSGEVEFKTTISDDGGSSSVRSGVRLDAAASPAGAQPSARLSVGGDAAGEGSEEEASANPEEVGGEEKQAEITEEKKESSGSGTSDTSDAGKQTAPKDDKSSAQKPQPKSDEAPKAEAKPDAAADVAPKTPDVPGAETGTPPTTGDESQPEGAAPSTGTPPPAPSSQPSGASGPGSEVGAPLPGNQGGPSQPGGGQAAPSGGGGAPSAGAGGGGGGGAAGAAASALKGGGGAKQKGPPTEQELREQQKKEEDSNFDFILLSLLLPAAILFDVICLIPFVAEIIGTMMMPVVRFMFWLLDIRPGRLIENLINRILEQQTKGAAGPSVPLPKETGKVLKVIFDALFVSLTVIRVVPFASEVSFSTSIFILTTYILCKAEERVIKKFKQALKVVGAVGRVVAKLPVGPEAQVIGGALAAADDVVNKGTPAGQAVQQEMSGAIGGGAGGSAGGAAGAGAQAGGSQAAMGMGKELGVGGQAAGAEQGTGPAGSPLMSGTPMYTGKQAPVDGIQAPAPAKRRKSDFDRMAQQGRIVSKRGQRARRKADEEAKKFMEENSRLAAGLIQAVEGDDGRFAGGTPGATGSPTFGADSGKPRV